MESVWDDGFTVKLGDEMNDFVDEKKCKAAAEAAGLVQPHIVASKAFSVRTVPNA